MTALAPRHRASAPTVEALVDAAIDGDERAWAAICEQHLPQVRAVAAARLRDAHAAEDVVQETFLRAWTRLPQVRDAARLGSWLKTIAANVAVDHVRRQRVTAPLEDARDTPAPGPSHDDVLVAREEAEVLHSHLDELRDVDRRALWQRDGHGVPVSELADELGMTTGSVRVMLTRARRRVRDGYGVLVAPLLGLVARWRHRLAGLGDAVPAAVAAPAVVVAVVAGVAVPAMESPSRSMPTTPVSVAPSASEQVAPASSGDEAVSPREPVTPRAATPALPGDSAAASPSAPSTPPAPEVEVGRVSAGFQEEPPAQEKDAGAGAPAGPVEELEFYIDETGIAGLEQTCLLCD